MTDIVAADIGGTHARFAIARLSERGAVALGEVTTLRTAEHASLELAWRAFAADAGQKLPRAAAIAVACPIAGDTLRLTNNPWTIRPALIAEELGLDALTLVNDFGAVGHAVACVGPEHFGHICGPEIDLPEGGVISIVGPGTGLGVAQLVRRRGRYEVIETEGGHIDFAPTDGIEDAIALRLRQRYRRVSVERVVSGPGLVEIYESLAMLEDRPVQIRDDKALWAAALEDGDSLAQAALERFFLILGGVAGDIALAQGARAVVIAGGVGRRVASRLPGSGFAKRFTAKGRFEFMMSQIPVKSLTHPHPGLFGVAVAFFEQHCADQSQP